MSNSLRRNTAFDLSKPEFQAPQDRLSANRWLSYATFGPGTPETDLSQSTKSNIVPRSDCQDDASVLMNIGYEAYIDAQLVKPIDSILGTYQSAETLENDTFNPNAEAINPYGGFTDGRFDAIFKTWWAEALHGDAQIRHKLAFALSQIMVVDENAGAGRGSYEHMSFYDSLIRATLSNNTSTYKTLLEDITYSRAMADMLTFIGNQKFNPTTNARPDENYARELLQLFSIGLKQLNMDGTPKLDENGFEMETYAPDDITNLASVFTGSDGGSTWFWENPPQYYVAEVAWDDRHEIGEKQLPAYPFEEPVIIPADDKEYKSLTPKPMHDGYVVTSVNGDTFNVDCFGRSSTRINLAVKYAMTPDMANYVSARINKWENGEAEIYSPGHGLQVGDRIYSYSSMQWSIKLTLDHIFNHPNVGPFMAKSLIKFFVTSNPNPEYVRRVAEVFNDNGNGVRGDLSAVVKAILLDREAIVPYGYDPLIHGRQTTIVDRLLRIGRAFKEDMIHASSGLQRRGATTSLIGPTFGNWPFADYPRVFTKPECTYHYAGCSQAVTGSLQVLRSPSVFNFYRPGYVPPSTPLSDVGKTAPELQINTVGEQISWMNQVSAMVETTTNGSSGYTDIWLNRNMSGNAILYHGMNFAGEDNGGVVSAKGTNQITIQMNNVTSAPNMTFLANRGSSVIRRRSDGLCIDGKVRSGQRTAAQVGENAEITFNTFTNSRLEIGDVVDLEPLWVMPPSGLSYRNSTIGHAMNFTFYKVAGLLPEKAEQSTEAELNVVIDYVESVLMTKPISAAVRAKMIEIGQVATTENAKLFGPQYDDYYANFHMTHSQQKVRRMIGILLISPEFAVLD